MTRATARHGAAALLAFTLSGCTGPQSTLDVAGREAERIANLFWWMTGGSLLVWAVVILLALYAAYAEPGEHRGKQAHRLIFAGALSPAIVLGGLLTYGLAMLPDMTRPLPDDALRISVYGERWWWRVRYEPPGAQPFELANEIRLPVGEPVEFRLHSSNVIHSFWIPSLGGKMDMIPGRVNRLVLHPTRTGRFRGACAEFCGLGHARMAFDTYVMDPPQFRAWLEQQAQEAGGTE